VIGVFALLLLVAGGGVSLAAVSQHGRKPNHAAARPPVPPGTSPLGCQVTTLYPGITMVDALCTDGALASRACGYHITTWPIPGATDLAAALQIASQPVFQLTSPDGMQSYIRDRSALVSSGHADVVIRCLPTTGAFYIRSKDWGTITSVGAAVPDNLLNPAPDALGP
jgi:hypothetical protein